MAAVEVPQTLEYRGGQLNAAPVLEVENFTNWKKRFMCHIIGIEPQFENIIKNGPFIPMVAGQRKPEGQWTADERKAANLDQRLKSLIMSVLPDDQMNSVINCLTAKSTWDDLILYHEGPSDMKESRVMDLKLCYNTFKFKEDYELASLFGKLKYEENLIDSIYKTEKKKSLVSTSPLSTALFSTSIVQDFQDSPDDEEDTRSSHECLNGLKEEYQARSLLAKSKRFFKKGTQRFSSAKATNQTECHKCDKKELRPTKDFEAKYNKVKAKLALLSSSASAFKSSTVKNKGLIIKAYEWDEEEVSSDDNEMVEVKVLMALAEENNDVSKKGARNSEWVKISMRKIPLDLDKKTLFSLLNHDTGRILPAESQRNTIDPSVVVTDSSATNYNSMDESSVYSTHLPPLKKLDGAERISRPKTIKSILRLKSTFKAETLKGVIINEPSSALAKDNKISSASKVNSAPVGKLKSVKIEDDPPLAIVIKELNNLKLQFSKSQSSYSKSNQPLQCDIKKPIWYLDSGCSRHMTGVKSYLHKYEEQPGPKVVFGDDSTCTTKGYGSIKCNGIVFTKFDEKRGTIFNSNKEVVMIISLKREIKPRNLQHVIKRCEACGSIVHTTTDHYDIEWFRRGEALQAKNAEALRLKKTGSSNANRSKTPTKCLHKDHLGKFDENADKVDNINIAKSKRYPPDEYLHPYEPYQRCQTNNNDVSFIEPYESPEPVVLETKVSSDQKGQADQNDQNDQPAQTNEILNDDQSEHSNHINDEQIIDNLPSTEDIQISKHLSSPIAEDTSVHDTIPITNHSLSILSMVSLAPQDSYQANPKESHLIVVKRIFRYLKGTPSLDMKSTSSACQLLGGKLVCWSAKKQQSVAMSLAKAEYVAAVRCCANILWMKNQLTNYDIIYEKISLYHRSYSIGSIELHFIPTQYQLADIFTKPLDESTFKRLTVELGMLNIDSKPEASVPPEEN
ncbi:hypothetical protein Tco_0730337 [Tanacetum coccineum]|uniref:Retrovirus-related Pol polyprotein from transposon TNT 1-94-like beta-barrel domain-containing protein n=1 Tax=Tanacetum coccineum TaxID=301880 RepID=A0ABQ4YSP9_9ASTR